MNGSPRTDLRFLTNGWAGWHDRVRMAWLCLRGEGVVFNARFYLSETEPVRVTPINPVSMLTVHSCLFVGDSDDPPVEPKLTWGDHS